MSTSILKQAKSARAASEKATAQMDKLHDEMLAEIDVASDSARHADFWTGVIRKYWRKYNGKTPRTCELVVAGIIMIGRISSLIPPTSGESVLDYVVRITEYVR